MPGRMLVVIPAFQERGRVGEVVSGVRTALAASDVLVVDDGSSDGTAAEAVAAGARVVSLPLNLGYGAALQTGYKYATRNGYEIVAQIDADGQHRPVCLRGMVAELERSGCDVVVGSRFLGDDGHYRPQFARQLGIKLFSRIASSVTRQRVTDPTSGLQVMRGAVAEFFCTNVYPTDYPDADILILLHRSGFTVREVPVQMRPEGGDSMHSGHRSVYYVYKMVLSIFVTMLRPRSGVSDDRSAP